VDLGGERNACPLGKQRAGRLQVESGQRQLWQARDVDESHRVVTGGEQQDDLLGLHATSGEGQRIG
jgi:hypothetical protein